jgi:hypothetical protein
VRTLNTVNHNGWQRGERLDGRDAVQQRVAGADKADEADDEAFVLGTTTEADGEDSDGWWWQSTEARAAKWAVLRIGIGPFVSSFVYFFFCRPLPLRTCAYILPQTTEPQLSPCPARALWPLVLPSAIYLLEEQQ